MYLPVRTGTIIGAAAVAAIIEIAIISLLIFQRNHTIALTEHWMVVEVTSGDKMLVRQADGKEMNVRLCGINALQASVEATKKLRTLVAAADNQVMIIPVKKDTDFYMISEVMVEGSGEAEISFQEELLKSGLAEISKSGLECPNQLAFKSAENIAKSSRFAPIQN